MTDINHEEHDTLDLDVQHSVAQAITEAEDSGLLIGQEAPVFKCHTFLPTGGGEVYAKAITNQLNHLASALGVLGFQVSYKEDSMSPIATKPDRGFFQVRVFANAPAE